MLQESDQKILQRAISLLKGFATEPFSKEKCEAAIESAILEFYKHDRQLLQNLIIKQKVKRINILGTEYGVFLITRDDRVMYKPIANAPFSQTIEFSLSSIKGMLNTKYMLESRAMEIFWHNKVETMLISFESESVLEIVSSYLQKHCKNLDRLFADLAHTRELWVEGRVSNSDYLLFVNRVALRSFNDLSQYPIFPWVLADYTSSCTSSN